MTSAPVFVDVSGRRARLVVAVCWLLACAFGSYVILVVAALFVPQGALSLSVPGLGPVLPKSGAPPITTSSGGSGAPATVLAPSGVPRPSQGVKGTPATPSATRPAAVHTTPTTLPTTRTTGRPTSAPSATAAPTSVRGTGKPTTHPTPRAHASKTPPAHP